MSRRRKKCRCCRELFQPHPQTYRQQITCDKPECRAWRRQQALEEWRAKNPVYEESRREKILQWQKEHGAAYMREYREDHPAYVEENRRRQAERDQKNGNLVKRNEWSRVCIEKRRRNRLLRDLVKRNEWPGVLWREIGGVWKELGRSTILVKRNTMA